MWQLFADVIIDDELARSVITTRTWWMGIVCTVLAIASGLVWINARRKKTQPSH